MSFNLFQTVKDAVEHLNPGEIRNQAERNVRVGIFAGHETGYQQMEAYFYPAHLSSNRRSEVANVIERATYNPDRRDPAYDIEIYSPEFAPPKHGFEFNLQFPEQTVSAIMKSHPDLAVSLARQLEPFREPVARSIVRRIAKENALFSLATAIPDIVPLLTLPWAVGEFASDTAVLTANQIRMAFLLAAASDRVVGYREQKAEIATILLGAFGWKAIARELVGKIPFGGGLIPKAAVAYAGTQVAGMSLERYYRVGYHFTRQEREAAYSKALERGKTIAGSVVNGIKRHQLS